MKIHVPISQHSLGRPLLLAALALVLHATAVAGGMYSAESPQRMRLLFDYFHHLKPSTKVGAHLVTGGWADNVGRYGLDDFSHTNSFDPVFIALEKDYCITIHEAPFSAEALKAADGVVIINPDSPVLTPTVPTISDDEIANLNAFVRGGGSLMVMINSGGHETEKFEEKQLRKLMRSFGLDWNSDDTHYSSIALGEAHPYFYDCPVFHYGAGCTIQVLETAEQPTVLMDVYSDATYPERHVKGHGIVLVRPGKGKVILVGDTGSWGANLARPWSENLRVLHQLFRYMAPSRDVLPPQLTPGAASTYDVTVAALEAIPVTNTVSDFSRPLHRRFFPRKKTGIPYLEASGEIVLKSVGRDAQQASLVQVDLTGFRWFDEPQVLVGQEQVTFTASRQGKVSGVESKGQYAGWIGVDLTALVALLPVDGLRPGDRWGSVEECRIPTAQGSDAPTTRTVPLEITYVRDETFNGRECRLLRTSREVWLNEIGVKIEDMLPVSELRRWKGARYEFLYPRGGSLMLRREQWVDKETGLVLKAKTQSRIIAWIHDLRRSVGVSNDAKDIEMVSSFAHIITFTRRD